ncbi:MAG: malate synthase A, partial [Bacteroidota bacterium]|nr:malate synthase A [Bacteroidota bacterium]
MEEAIMTRTTLQFAKEVTNYYPELLTDQALEFLIELHQKFNRSRLQLLEERTKRQIQFDLGVFPEFSEETQQTRTADWKVKGIPEDLLDRRVEITGPVDRKMVINALNSGASVFMADFEDATTPTWQNLVEGQINLRDA